MTRITYRKSLAAFPSVRPLISLVEELNKNVQLGIMSDVYVDDFWTRARDLESAMKLRESIIQFVGMQVLTYTNGPLEIQEPGRTNCKVFRETAVELTIKSDDYGIKTKKRS